MSSSSTHRLLGTPRRVFLPIASAAVVALVVAACGAPSTAPGGNNSPPLMTELPRQLTAAEQSAVAAGNDFSISLFRSVNEAMPAGENVAISPFSASVALGMTMNGAAGATYDAMQSTLGLDGESAQQINSAYRDLWKLLAGLDPSIQLTSANAIFYRNSFHVVPAFAQTSQDYFGADLRALDFGQEQASLAEINGWASEKTNGRIPKVLDEITREQVMFLLNALYFKGEWRARFDAARTSPGPFLGDDGVQRTVPLMHGSDMPLKLGGDSDVEMGELAYGNGAYAMTIMLPRSGQTVDDLIAGLTPTRWSTLIGTLNEANRTVVLPKFTVKYSGKWNDELTGMGMGIAFTRQADFSRLFTEDDDLKLDFVKQDVFLAVDEVGTEAAAVTTVGVGTVSAPMPFAVDRPFVFAIRDRLSGTILFIGAVKRLG